MDFLDSSLKIPGEIEPLLGVPVLATIPEISRTGQRFRHRLNQIFSAIFIMIGFALFAAFAILSVKGVARTMAFVKNYI
ncbi:hypothetical protein DENIS_0170 [Desulfonema ishimotonii]|uniref:Uncharacterized protein n=1 Tax=Desulfonema ishimotonii TaxID=45657 RepID=A0A401FQH0_9BACT|nr:hypothetical protein [Desulfonema ishimotonii]GBC59234.1 hypothetical protein DENIS_0170 [Desulfonema ishimotonii]